MGMTVVSGPASAGKTRHLVDALSARAPGTRGILVVPSFPDVRRSRREIAGKGLLGIEIHTFEGWVRHLWGMRGDGRRLVDDATRAALIAQAIGATRLERLAPIAETPGLTRLLTEVAGRADLDALAPANAFAAEVAQVLGTYIKVLTESGYAEVNQAARSLGGGLDLAGAVVAVNHFTDLSEWQEAFLVDAAGSAEVLVALSFDEGVSGTHALGDLVARLEGGGASRVRSQRESWTVPGLEALTDALFAGRQLGAAPEALRFGLAADPAAEIHLIVQEARRLIEGGTELDRIAVGFRDLSAIAHPLAVALDAAGIPAHVDASVRLPATSMGAALLGLFEGVQEGPDQRFGMHSFLAGPYGGARFEDVALADARWRRYRTAGKALVGEARALGDGCAKAISLAEKLAGAPLTEQTAKKWKELVDQLLLAAASARCTDPHVGAQDAAVHRTVLETVSALVAIPGAGIGGDQVRRALAALSVATGGPEQPGRVVVTEVHRLRSRRFDAVILGGLTANEFAAEKREPLSVTLLGELGQPVGRAERESERLLFYLVASRARKTLTLVRREFDEGGQPLRASTFWDEVTALYSDSGDEPGVAPESRCVRASLSDLERVAPAFARGRLELRQHASCRRPRTVRSGLTSAQGKDEVARERVYSVSELEAYAQCPRKWFIGRMVRPKELDTSFDAAARGSYAHALLKEFYGRWHESGEERVSAATVGSALSLFDRCVETLEHTGAPAIGLAEEVARAGAAAYARAIVADDATFLPGFKPAAHELAFGDDDAPFTFAGVRVRGRIDRVDEGPGGLLVIDYKSSNTIKGAGSFETYGLLQPVVYAAAASALLGKPAVGGVYRSMGSLAVRGYYREGLVDLGARGTGTDALDADAFEAVVASAVARIGEIVARMRAGDVSSTPSNDACAYCPMKPVCEVAS